MANIYNSQLDAFDLYHQYNQRKKKKSHVVGPALPALGHALAGSTGAAISNVCTYPLDLIITRLQIQRQFRKSSSEPRSDEYKSIKDAAEKIYQEDGLAGFYLGLLQDTSKTVADSFLFFLAYNFLRQTRLRSRKGTHHLPVLDELCVGFIAGSFAKFCTTPLANIVTRIQTASMVSSRSSDQSSAEASTVRSIARQIRAEKGLQGFWSGYSASLVLTLNPTLTFLYFETFKRLLLRRERRSDPPPTATFLIAAISKALASTITYPFSLAKARAQASSHSTSASNSSNSSDAKSGDSAAPPLSPHATVFSTVLQIAQAEGVSALYEGLPGEVLKGFFSHGITMLLKESLHSAIIALYYAMLKALRRYPNPEELAYLAKGQAQDAIATVQDGVRAAEATVAGGLSAAATGSVSAGKAAAESVRSAVDDGVDSAAKTMESVYEEGREVAGRALEDAHEIRDLLADYVGQDPEDRGLDFGSGDGNGWGEGE